jgi:hypothetical protein
VFQHPADMMNIAQQRQVARRSRASMARFVRTGRRHADRAELSSHDATVITLTSPSVHEASYAARVA